MNEERKRILQMLAEGKISVDEAEELLATVEDERDTPVAHKDAKFLRIKVWDDGQEKVNVNLPLSLAKLAMKLIPGEAKMKLEEQEINLNEIIKEIQHGASTGKVVEVEDDGNRVEIYVE